MNQRWQGSFRSNALVPIVRSLTMIREDLFARHGELFPMLLQAGVDADNERNQVKVEYSVLVDRVASAFVAARDRS